MLANDKRLQILPLLRKIHHLHISIFSFYTTDSEWGILLRMSDILEKSDKGLYNYMGDGRSKILEGTSLCIVLM